MAHDQHDEQQTAPPSEADLHALNSPGPEHEALAPYTGTWQVTIRLQAGDQTLVYTGTATHRMVAGGRFLLCEYQATGNADAVEGLFTLGFDRRHAAYTIQAIDTWGTYFVTARGPRPAEATPIKLYGTDDDPHLQAMGITKEFGYTLRFENDTFTIEVFMIDNRTEARHEINMMEYVFSSPQPQS